MNKDLNQIAKLLEARFPRSRVETQPSGSFGPEPMIVLNFDATTDAIAAIEYTNAKNAGEKSIALVVIRAANSDYAKAGSDKNFKQKFKYQSPEHLVSKFVETANSLLKDMQELGVSLTVQGAKNPLDGITAAFGKKSVCLTLMNMIMEKKKTV